MLSFGHRLQAAVAGRGNLCVGIDPHSALLESWGLADTAAGLRDFSLRVIDAAADRVAVVKPQVAFFERHGSAGLAVLEEVCAAARAAGVLLIADAKRSDIGSTMQAYAQSWLAPGGAFDADALTVSPYMGLIDDVLRYVQGIDKGLFVLTATSNPEGARIQQSRTAQGTLAGEIVAQLTAFNADHTVDGAWASMGMVIGATVSRRDYGLPEHIDPPTPILAPGFGHQGAQLQNMSAIFGSLAPTVLANESRSILSAGPNGLSAAIDQRQRVLREAIA